jgi:hypothetical protein
VVVLVRAGRRATSAVPWTPFAPHAVLALEPGAYTLWIDAPRRMVGYAIDPDVGAVELVHLASRSPVAVSGPGIFGAVRKVGRHHYPRSSFQILQPGEYALHLTLGAGRRSEDLGMRVLRK